jgi:hypothetical protein
MDDREEAQRADISTGLMKPRLMRPASIWRMMSSMVPLSICMRISGYLRAMRDRKEDSTPIVAG